jgi:rhodanese-related sulfurtransferase
MGPFIPFELITPGWGLVIMFLIGISFGFILESAGFSSSRKLVGIFYGYDFVVLKVFFTAGLTAMIGLIFMQYFDMIDMTVVNINSNFLWSALAGGVIMGFGFILGGFCPGTSLTAAVIGKIDAWFFIIGIFIGIFIFGQFSSSFNSLFSGYYFDREMIHDTIGIKRGWFVLMMIMMAVVAFAIGHSFEKKAKPELKPTNLSFSGYKMEIFFLIVLGIIILRIPEKSAQSFFEPTEKTILQEIVAQDRFVDSDLFAYNIMHNVKEFQIVDVRTPKEFEHMHFPGSVNIPLNDLLNRDHKEFFSSKGQKVLVSNGATLADMGWVLLRRAAYKDIFVLRGGINLFISEIFYATQPQENEFKYDVKFDYRFRQKAAEFFKSGEIQKIMPEKKAIAPTDQTQVKVVKSAGGC